MDNLFALLLLISLVLLVIGLFKPASSLFWYKKERTRKRSGMIYGGLIILFFILFGVTTESKKADTSNIKGQQKIMASSVKKDDPKNSENSTTASSSTTENVNSEMDLKAKIANSIKSIDGGDDLTSSPLTSAQDFTIVAALFKAYAMTINEGKQSTDKDVLKLTSELQKKVIASQQKNFPKIRKAYYQFVKDKLWENDVYVNIAGSGNTIIKFTGGYFAANKNIKETQETLSEMLNLLRFKQTQYRWYKGEDEYTYYTIDSPKDTELEE